MASFIEDVVPRPWTKEPRVTGSGEISLHDLITILTEVKNPREAWAKLKKLYPDFESKYEITSFQFPGAGERDTPIIPIKHIKDAIHEIVAGARIPVNRKTMLTGKTVPLRQYTEVEIHTCIKSAFGEEPIILQFPVGKYKIDMYFTRYKLAVECDENGHNKYDEDKDLERTNYINEKLNCIWIRYDPYNNFDIFTLIHNIRVTINFEEKAGTREFYAKELKKLEDKLVCDGQPKHDYKMKQLEYDHEYRMRKADAEVMNAEIRLIEAKIKFMSFQQLLAPIKPNVN